MLRKFADAAFADSFLVRVASDSGDAFCSSGGFSDSIKKKTIDVLFIGGVTYAETAALRAMNATRTDVAFRTLATTTLNGDRFVKAFVGR